MSQIEFTLSWDTCQAKNSSLWNITLETWAAIVDSVPGVIVAPLEGNIKLPTKNKLDFARLEFTLAVKHLFALILKLLKSLKLLLINTETDKVCNFDLKKYQTLLLSIQNSSDMISCMFFLNHWLCHVQKIDVVFLGEMASIPLYMEQLSFLVFSSNYWAPKVWLFRVGHTKQSYTHIYFESSKKESSRSKSLV